MYVFEGETIKLNSKDFDVCMKQYAKIDLVKELEQLDLALRGKKGWWVAMHQMLNYRNNTMTYQVTTRLMHTVTDRSCEISGNTKTKHLRIADQLKNTDWAKGI